MKTIHKIIIAVVVCVIALLGVRYITSTGKDLLPGENGPKPVEVTPATSGDIVRKITAAGTLVANQSVILRPEVEGKIAEILFTEGQDVKKGDPLYKIDEGPYRAQVNEAQAKLALSREEYKRAIALLNKGFGTTQMRDKALSVLKINEAELEAAQIKLNNTTIKAPFEGTVGISQVSVGAFVSASVELVQIVDLSPINVDFSVPESNLGHFNVGDTIDVTIEGVDLLPMEAKIKAISPQIDVATRTIIIRAVLENAEKKLRPGQFARVIIETGKNEGAVLIPESAVEREGDEEIVYKVVDGVAIRTVVDTDMRDGREVEITSGLKPGDLVIVAGQVRVSDGQEVTVIEHDPNAPKAKDAITDDVTPTEEE